MGHIAHYHISKTGGDVVLAQQGVVLAGVAHHGEQHAVGDDEHPHLQIPGAREAEPLFFLIVLLLVVLLVVLFVFLFVLIVVLLVVIVNSLLIVSATRKKPFLPCYITTIIATLTIFAILTTINILISNNV